MGSDGIDINGDINGDLHIHQNHAAPTGGNSGLDEIEWIHATEVIDLATNEIVAGDVLLHIGGFYKTREEAERAMDGGHDDPDGGHDDPVDDTCIENRNRAALDMQDTLFKWFSGEWQGNQCIDDGFLQWALREPDNLCYPVRDFIAQAMDSTGLNFYDQGKDVEQNRPWMHEEVEQAMFNVMDACFPDFRPFTEANPHDAVDSDYVRSLCSAFDDPANCVNHDDGNLPDNADELQAVIDSMSLENMLWHWFFQATIQSEPVPWDDVITYLFTHTGTHCHETRDYTADIFEAAGINWKIADDWIAANRPWIHEEPLNAYKAHWAKCFPNLDELKEGLTDAETGPAWIRTLQPVHD